jgi:antitoxin CptB
MMIKCREGTASARPKRLALDFKPYPLLGGGMARGTTESIEEYRRKLKFRAWHRGTREMDLLLGSFADQNIEKFDETKLAEFEKLLENPDPDLYDWVSGQKKVSAEEESSVMTLLLAHRFAR